jgi:hypothetical protein
MGPRKQITKADRALVPKNDSDDSLARESCEQPFFGSSSRRAKKQGPFKALGIYRKPHQSASTERLLPQSSVKHTDDESNPYTSPSAEATSKRSTWSTFD